MGRLGAVAHDRDGAEEPGTQPVRVRPVGTAAVLAEVAGAAEALDLATWARQVRLEAVEVVPAARTVLFDGVDDPARLARDLERWTPGERSTSGEVVEVAVDYDGPDLEDVAAAWGTDAAGVVARHTSTEFVAEFCGFAPGFAYLAGLPDDLAVARLATPRPRVPAGSVALAGTWCGIYPSASPGGWRLVGRTDSVLWDPSRERPALLPPGTRVRFTAGAP
jgi:KipI family sensor histidine kinase inhibitor